MPKMRNMMKLFGKKEREAAQAIELVPSSIAQPSNTGIAPVAAAALAFAQFGASSHWSLSESAERWEFLMQQLRR